MKNDFHLCRFCTHYFLDKNRNWSVVYVSKCSLKESKRETSCKGFNSKFEDINMIYKIVDKDGKIFIYDNESGFPIIEVLRNDKLKLAERLIEFLSSQC